MDEGIWGLVNPGSDRAIAMFTHPGAGLVVLEQSTGLGDMHRRADGYKFPALE